MSVVLGGAGFILLGAALIWMWKTERSDRTVYERNLSAFSQVVAPEFARGFAGAQIVLSCGLLVLGLLAVVVGPVADSPEAPAPIPVALVKVMLILGMTAILASLFVTWLGRPKFLFPPHARDDVAPLKAWWARKRNRQSGIARFQ